MSPGLKVTSLTLTSRTPSSGQPSLVALEHENAATAGVLTDDLTMEGTYDLAGVVRKRLYSKRATTIICTLYTAENTALLSSA